MSPVGPTTMLHRWGDEPGPLASYILVDHDFQPVALRVNDAVREAGCCNLEAVSILLHESGDRAAKLCTRNLDRNLHMVDHRRALFPPPLYVKMLAGNTDCLRQSRMILVIEREQLVRAADRF